MKSFRSLATCAAEMTALEAGVVFQLEKGLEAVAAKIGHTAKQALGQYQEAVGPFPGWEELADSTKADRVRQGYTENDPGLHSGQMRDSIEHQTQGLEAVIGSSDDRLVWFELGTTKQPPRPVLGPAVEHTREAIRKIVGSAVVKGLLGGRSIPASLEYDHETRDLEQVADDLPDNHAEEKREWHQEHEGHERNDEHRKRGPPRQAGFVRRVVLVRQDERIPTIGLPVWLAGDLPHVRVLHPTHPVSQPLLYAVEDIHEHRSLQNRRKNCPG
ncbi:MAG TPA: hypothetical protein ACQGQI_05175 [Xylella sp.]